jgi:20S proteasome subunit beta 3
MSQLCMPHSVPNLGFPNPANPAPLRYSSELFRYKVNMYRLREERDIEPETMANLVSSTLYERRFGPYYVSPVIAGINQRTEKPFICGFDSIG